MKLLDLLNNEVKGPCGCGLNPGDEVIVEGMGRGTITGRTNRILKVEMNFGRGEMQVDQNFVHHAKKVL